MTFTHKNLQSVLNLCEKSGYTFKVQEKCEQLFCYLILQVIFTVDPAIKDYSGNHYICSSKH